ncbi:MAG: tripartite tricarboxylate transporter substrate binding protein [Burkholderiales bacterium]|nr:tripartite tricarboxylate transporter substrate binding protein [Burkholderiales bacterium]
MHLVHRLAVLAALCLAVPGHALAQAFPGKPVRIVLMYPPGGGADALNRTVAEKLSPLLGQPVVVDNRPGGGGVIAAEAVARAAPDGHTLLHAGPPIMTLTPALVQKVPYDPKAFVPVAALTITQYLLLARAQFPAGNLRELSAEAKARPGRIDYGTWGQGSITHVAGEMLNHRAGLDLAAVPYKGEAQVIQDLLGGQIPLGWATLPVATQHIRSGRLKAIGIASPARYELLPEVPTFIEQGLADFALLGWSGIVAPPGTPRDITTRLNADINAALRDAAVQERLGKMGLTIIAQSAEQFGELIRSDIGRVAPVLKAIAPKLR